MNTTAPDLLWVLVIELNSLVLRDEHLYKLSHLTGQEMTKFQVKFSREKVAVGKTSNI